MMTCARKNLIINSKFLRLGAGMTWGTSKFGHVGVHELAKDAGRVVVSGHAGNVGVVGWSLGGGHGQLVGVHGLGVDQVLEVLSEVLS